MILDRFRSAGVISTMRLVSAGMSLALSHWSIVLAILSAIASSVRLRSPDSNALTTDSMATSSVRYAMWLARSGCSGTGPVDLRPAAYSTMRRGVTARPGRDTSPPSRPPFQNVPLHLSPDETLFMALCLLSDAIALHIQ